VTRFSAAFVACFVLSSWAFSSEPALGALDLGEGTPATGRAVALEGWRVSVSVEPTRLGPLVVSVGLVRPAAANAAGAWVQHEVLFANRGDRPVQFADIGFAGLLPQRRPVLIAGDQRCGPTPSRPITFACRLYIDALAIAPHSSESRTITLYKGLRGLRPAASGTYFLKTPIRFMIGREIPEEGTGLSAVLRIEYEIESP
jgi:hypothetical protein